MNNAINPTHPTRIVARTFNRDIILVTPNEPKVLIKLFQLSHTSKIKKVKINHLKNLFIILLNIFSPYYSTMLAFFQILYKSFIKIAEGTVCLPVGRDSSRRAV